MKYLVVIADGMADKAVELLGGKTPMEAAKKPAMDALAKESFCGLVSNVPKGMVPESDTANLAILSYDPRVYSKGRSPLEAVSMGIDMQPDETAYRCNLVTLSEEGEKRYAERRMLDHSADEITTEEADKLIEALDKALGNESRRLYTGISYRHCLIWKNAPGEYPFERPHDIIGQCIGTHLPSGEEGKPYLEMMEMSYEILKDHPVNQERRRRGLKPANSIWLWSPGKKPALPSFEKKWGMHGAVISAVDLIKGIGICASMKSIDVDGATGNLHTNYKGKAEAARKAFEEGCDFVYVHVEAPDECGHRGEAENKVLAIENIDRQILEPLVQYLRNCGEAYKIMVLPDHPTPVALRTHTMEPVPFLIYDSEKSEKGIASFTEVAAAETGRSIADGCHLLEHMIQTGNE